MILFYKRVMNYNDDKITATDAFHCFIDGNYRPRMIVKVIHFGDLLSPRFFYWPIREQVKPSIQNLRV